MMFVCPDVQVAQWNNVRFRSDRQAGLKGTHMMMNQWEGRGTGFTLRDGRICTDYRVVARSAKNAIALLNNIAQWRAFIDIGSLGLGVPATTDAELGVWLLWPGERDFERQEFQFPPVTRRSGVGPVSPTARVVQSWDRLRDKGGHRSTVRFSSEAWQALLFLDGKIADCRTYVLEKLILQRAEELGWRMTSKQSIDMNSKEVQPRG